MRRRRWGTGAVVAALKEVRLTAPTAATFGPAVASAPSTAPLSATAWVVARSALSGRADAYVDGEKATTVDFGRSKVGYRNAIWTRTWAESAPHTVRIVVEGTPRRPTVLTDGLVYLK
ncbi:hypothetical protein [Streptomyces sp. BK239]|uniref:hypothetical protein n=1 Tax=Streptomyces sp. BK239 TaxID=2512155 RepID=UPI00102AFB34